MRQKMTRNVFRYFVDVRQRDDVGRYSACVSLLVILLFSFSDNEMHILYSSTYYKKQGHKSDSVKTIIVGNVYEFSRVGRVAYIHEYKRVRSMGIFRSERLWWRVA